ncbi:hypothetical protein, partial [Pedobacter psychrotolerans]|uniref:hypothetical protein n=1 Tax=Pedobacter psychrotolerans TaxID=1843235 RepID=UPI001E2C0F43
FQAPLLKKRRGVAIAITYRSVSHRLKLSFSFDKYFFIALSLSGERCRQADRGFTSLHLFLSFRAQRRIPAFLTTSICRAPTFFQSPAAKIQPPRLSGTPP